MHAKRVGLFVVILSASLLQAQTAPPQPLRSASGEVPRAVPAVSKIAGGTMVSARSVDVTAAPYHADPAGTIDSTPAYRMAVTDVCAAGGGVIYFPPGTYMVMLQGVNEKGALPIPCSNIAIRGAGPGVTTIALYTQFTTDRRVIRPVPAGQACPVTTVVVDDGNGVGGLVDYNTDYRQTSPNSLTSWNILPSKLPGAATGVNRGNMFLIPKLHASGTGSVFFTANGYTRVGSTITINYVESTLQVGDSITFGPPNKPSDAGPFAPLLGKTYSIRAISTNKVTFVTHDLDAEPTDTVGATALAEMYPTISNVTFSDLTLDGGQTQMQQPQYAAANHLSIYTMYPIGMGYGDWGASYTGFIANPHTKAPHGEDCFGLSSLDSKGVLIDGNIYWNNISFDHMQFLHWSAEPIYAGPEPQFLSGKVSVRNSEFAYSFGGPSFQSSYEMRDIWSHDLLFSGTENAINDPYDTGVIHGMTCQRVGICVVADGNVDLSAPPASPSLIDGVTASLCSRDCIGLNSAHNITVSNSMITDPGVGTWSYGGSHCPVATNFICGRGLNINYTSGKSASSDVVVDNVTVLSNQYSSFAGFAIASTSGSVPSNISIHGLTIGTTAYARTKGIQPVDCGDVPPYVGSPVVQNGLYLSDIHCNGTKYFSTSLAAQRNVSVGLSATTVVSVRPMWPHEYVVYLSVAASSATTLTATLAYCNKAALKRGSHCSTHGAVQTVSIAAGAALTAGVTQYGPFYISADGDAEAGLGGGEPGSHIEVTAAAGAAGLLTATATIRDVTYQ